MLNISQDIVSKLDVSILKKQKNCSYLLLV